MPSIMIDIDDTVADFCKKATEVLNTITQSQSTEEDFRLLGSTHWGITDPEFRQLMIDGYIFEHLEPFGGAVEWVNTLYSKRCDIVFCTARGFHPNAEKITMDWLEKCGFAYDNLWVVDNARDKQELNRSFDVIIDDNINSFSPESVVTADFLQKVRYLIRKEPSKGVSDSGADNGLGNIDVLFEKVTDICTEDIFI